MNVIAAEPTPADHHGPFACATTGRPLLLATGGAPEVPRHPPGVLEGSVIPVIDGGRIAGWELSEPEDLILLIAYRNWVAGFASTWTVGCAEGAERFWELAARSARQQNRALGIWGTLGPDRFLGDGVRLEGRDLTLLSADLRVLVEVLATVEQPACVMRGPDDDAVLCGEVLADEWGDHIVVDLFDTDGARAWLDAGGLWVQAGGAPARNVSSWATRRIDGDPVVVCTDSLQQTLELRGNAARALLGVAAGSAAVRVEPGTCLNAWTRPFAALTTAVEAARRDRTPLMLHIKAPTSPN